jgi:hypothetical protein
MRIPEMFTPRKVREQIEAKLEAYCMELFSGCGMIARRQVRCEAGIADIVTDDTIYELKAFLNRRTLYQAIGQLQFYRPHLNSSARLAIICKSSSVRKLHPLARLAGVEVFEKGDIICCNPPYAI